MIKLITFSIFIFTILFSCSIIAQQMMTVSRKNLTNPAEKIMKPMGAPLPAGTYSIGSYGDFLTIDSAFKKLSTDGIAGVVILELIDTLYTAPSTVYGFYLKGPVSGATKDNRVTIRPAADKKVTIRGSGESVLRFWNVSYLTLDGVSLNGNTTLKVHALKNTQFYHNDAVIFLSNSDHNIIQNITASSDDYTRGYASIGFFLYEMTNSAADSNLIQNNFVPQGGWGSIYVSALLPDFSMRKKAIGNIISGNLIGSETDSLNTTGIQIECCENTIVENNSIQNIRHICKDKQITAGIAGYWCFSCIIRNNIIFNFDDNDSQMGTGAIILSGAANKLGNNNIICNNMVYDIRNSSKNLQSVASGIYLRYQNNPKVYYNSVYLYGKGSSPSGSAAFYIGGQCTNVEAKNNIFVNTRDEGSHCGSAIYSYTANITSDYNDLYYERNEYNCAVRIGNTKYSVNDWQSDGQDLHSISEMPNFKDPNLHIDESIPTNLEKRALVLADVNSDFDGDLRDANLPDIGADEFNGKVVPGPLTGAYSVGANGYFTSIDSAFNRLSTDGVAAPVTLELIDTLYIAPTDSFGFFLNGPILGADQDNGVTIKPASNKNVTIKGSGESVLRFLNTSYLTLDGVSLNETTTLTVHALQNYNFIENDAIDFLCNSDHNIVQNITAVTEDYNRMGLGIGFWINDPNGNEAPDSNLIQNNFVKKAGYAGILVSGLAADLTKPDLIVLGKEAIGNVIKGNSVGLETDSLITQGIQAECCKNITIENNEVQNIRYNLGVWVTHGINCYWSSGTIIRNNIVHNIDDNGSPDGTAGILLSGGSGRMGSNNMVYNNMIYDIRNSSKNSQSCGAGILMWQQTSPKIYFNSVYLNGKGSSPSGSAALYIEGACSNVEAKNNIFINTRDEGAYCASAIYNYSTSNLTSDNNALYYEQNQYNCLVKAGGIDHKTLADWQAKNTDLHSITEMPNFIAPHLHIDESIATNLESHGVPISGIDGDYDGDVRDSSTTDIGADEFNGTPLVRVDDELIQSSRFALEQNYPNPFNPTTNIQYSIANRQFVDLKVFNVLGQEIETLVNEEKPAGNYQIEFNATDLPSGVYFCRIQAGSFNQVRKMLLIK